MNERQCKLYQTLEEISKTSQKWVAKEEICELLSTYYPRHIENNSEHNSSAYAKIRIDVREINKSDEVEKVIVSNKKGYKIATKEEAAKYIEKRFRRDLKALKLDWHLKKKCNLDGQLNIDLHEVKAYVESAT